MKTSIVYLIIGLLMINTLSGQVKIGNNPQNLDPASVLELESTTRVLVITRVTDAQMSVINPLPGALVYNIDQECLHYYNGSSWINICEELDNSFTTSTKADYLSQLNPQARDSTVVITPTTNPDGSINYNFEVGQITGANIVTQSINGDSKIQPTSITTGLLAPKSVTIGKFADATGGQPGDIFQWNGSQWTLVNESILGITEKDSIVGNEVVGPFDTTLQLEGAGSEVDPFTLDVSEGGITAFEIATGAVTTEEILDGTLLTEDIANDAVTTDKIGTTGAADANRILGTDISGNPQWQDAATLATSLGEDVSSTNGSILGVQANAALVPMDLEVNVDNATLEVDPTNGVQIADGGVTTNQILNGSVTNDKLDKLNIPLSGFGAAGADIDLGTNKIVNVVDPTDPQDAATKAYVDALDGTDDQDLGIGAGGTLNESVELTITDGTSATIDIRDADSDTTNELQNIEEVLTDGNDANGAVITGLGTPTAASDAATKAYVDALDGTDDQDLGIGAGGTLNESVELTITDGTSATIDIRDADSDTTNELQNIEEVLTDGNDANGAVITGLGTPTAASDAATKAYVDNVTDEIALANQVASGSSTSTGEYTINDPLITASSIIHLTVEENASGDAIMIQLATQIIGSFSVKIYEFTGGGSPALTDANWQYIVINP